ncbi:hypothetical protein [Albibacterium profundi]|uniref:Homeodomain-like domain-containing protein n=1 Tax=Albibacterium profundi TaxID=3134906 RepID=A0ABV5CEW4_9SPHI
MSSRNRLYKSARQKKEARLAAIAALYRKGWSYRAIAAKIQEDLGVKISHMTVKNDVQTLLVEWRENRVEDMDLAVQLELERIDATIMELWDAWEKSKEDQELKSEKKKGVLLPNGRKIVSKDGDLVDERSIRTIAAERTEKTEIGYGDVRYITEIRHQLIERRKIMGMYAAEKKEVEMTRPEINVNELSKEELQVLAEINRKREVE